MRTKDKICLYTLFFPYGSKEISIQTEISFLSRAFEHVYILPGQKLEEVREQAANVEVVDPFQDQKPKPFNIGNALSLISQNLNAEFIKNVRYELNYQRQLLHKSELLTKWIIESEMKDAVHYTHWFDEWATILAMVKKNIPELKIIARAHGFDLYEDRSKLGYFPYRKMQLDAVERVFAVSRLGEEYLKERYPEHSEKISMRYLGISSLSRSPFMASPVHIVTISNLIPLKQVGLLVLALSMVKSKIKWTHFGEGELFEEIVESAHGLPANVTCSFRGFIPNSELMRELSQMSINLFVNLSSSEGLPLSMMEVMSAGIPVLATDVGGVSEIVTSRTGILLSADVSVKEIAEILDGFEHHSLNSVKARKRITEFWGNHFDARKNVNSFVHYLQSIS